MGGRGGREGGEEEGKGGGGGILTCGAYRISPLSGRGLCIYIYIPC